LLETLCSFLTLVRGQVIKDDHIALRQRRRKLGLHIGFEDAPSHRPINHPGGTKLMTAQPGDKGLVFQWPNGAFEYRRCPLGQRPRRRVILVEVPVSSRKTSRCGSCCMRGWRLVRQCSRAWRTSERPCSLARSVFFLGWQSQLSGRMERWGSSVPDGRCGMTRTSGRQPPDRERVLRPACRLCPACASRCGSATRTAAPSSR
jgi:hypothetical protein